MPKIEFDLKKERQKRGWDGRNAHHRFAKIVSDNPGDWYFKCQDGTWVLRTFENKSLGRTISTANSYAYDEIVIYGFAQNHKPRDYVPPWKYLPGDPDYLKYGPNINGDLRNI